MRLGQVASHSFMSTLSAPASKQMMSRTRHVVLQDVAWLQLVFPNWISDELTIGGAATITAAVEYPVGTFTQVKFSGVASGTIPDMSYIVSDPVSVVIPSGAVFFVRSYYTNAAGICYNSHGCNVSAGETCTFAASGVVDQTMGGTITNTSGNVGYGPLAILSITNKPSFFLIGDSRGFGVNDSFTGTSDGIGELARSFGDSYAYINGCISGANASTMVSQGATGNKAKLAQFCTHVVFQDGINDLVNNRGAAQLEADVQTIRAFVSRKKFYACTVAPKSASTDAWATTVNQTVDATTNAPRIAYNAWVRANTGGFDGFVEIADQVESARDSGLWKAPSYTTDGLHESQTACVAIQSSNAFNPAALV